MWATVVFLDRDASPLSVTALDAAFAGSRNASVDVVVVDCRTSGKPRAWTGRPGIEVVGAGADVEPAALWNRGAAFARGDAVAFFDGTSVGVAGWLDAAAAQLARPDVAAVAPVSDGLGEPTMSFTGLPGVHHQSDTRRVHDALYAHPEAQIYDRAAFVAAGGFSADVRGPSAAIDLGWRLRLAGARVVADPACRVDATCSCALVPSGGLATVHACLGDDALTIVLPAAIALTAARDPGDVDDFVDALPRLTARRAAVQASRTVPDASLLDLVIGALEPSRAEWRWSTASERYEDAIEGHPIESVFRRRQRILVLTPDVFTEKLAGPAIRAWQISEALAADHVVHLATTSGLCTIAADLFEVSAPDDHELRELAQWADLLVVQGFVLETRPYLRDHDKVMVVDVYDPLHLEQLELFRDDTDGMRRITVRGAVTVLNEQLARGDFLLCASDKQRDLWLGHLSAVGRINHLTYDEDDRLESLLAVVPFGLPDDPPTHTAAAAKGVVPGIADDDELILWGGGIYNWFDPLTLVRAVDRLRLRRPKVRLFFMGLRHPNPDVTEMRMATETRRLARELGLTGTHVFFNEGWVRYEERQNYLLEADVGVSTHLDHVETAFSFRTRILDYLWAALPIVATEGDSFAPMIASEHLGIVVPAEDVEALEEALFRVLDDREFADRCRANLAARRGDFTWTRVLAPLVEFCRRPRRAPDLLDPDMVDHLWQRPEPKPTHH